MKRWEIGDSVCIYAFWVPKGNLWAHVAWMYFFFFGLNKKGFYFVNNMLNHTKVKLVYELPFQSHIFLMHLLLVKGMLSKPKFDC